MAKSPKATGAAAPAANAEVPAPAGDTAEALAPFALVLPTVHGRKLKGIGDTVLLTRDKHAAFVAAGRVAATWPDTEA